MTLETKMRAATEQGQDLDNNLIGEFIAIAAWEAYGWIVEQEPAYIGPEGSIRVRVQTDPEGLEPAVWFHLEPGQYTLD